MKSLKVITLSIATILCTGVQAADTLSINLQKAIEYALAENPTIKVADKEVKLKELSKEEAWQNLLPSITATGSLQHTLLAAVMNFDGRNVTIGKDGTNTAALSGTLNLPLFVPSLYSNMSITKQDLLLAREQARSSRLTLVNSVTKGYYDLLLAQETENVMKQSYRVSKENFELVDKKFKVGTVSEYDKISAEVQMRSMSTTLVQASNALYIAGLKLKVLLGITADIQIKIDDDLTAYEGSLTLENVETGALELTNNTALKQLDITEKKLKKSINLLKTNFMPSLSFQLTGQYQSLYNPNYKLWDYDWSPSSTFSLALSIPIFNMTHFTKMRSGRMQLSQLQDTRTNTFRQLNLALEGYKDNMISAISEVASNKEAVLQADKARKIAEKRYDVGQGTILELNQSELTLTQAQLTFCQSIYNYLSNKADFDHTLGRGY